MIKRIFVFISTLSILSGFYITSFATEPMLKIKLYAPTFMVSSLENVLSYGVAFTDSSGFQKLIAITSDHENETNLTTHDGGTFSISYPRDWTIELLPDTSLSFKKSNQNIGSFMIMDYDPALPLSQFEGNHAEALSVKQLEGFSYPTTKVLIRRSQPAASNDTSYVDELYIYLIPENSKFAYTLYFDSSKIDEKTAIEIAQNITINTYPMQLHNIAEKWAEAVKSGDGKAQYELLSTELKLAVYADYEACHWKNTTPMPCVESYSVRARSNEATITYHYINSTGSVIEYYQTIILIEENGTFYIDYFTHPEKHR